MEELPGYEKEQKADDGQKEEVSRYFVWSSFLLSEWKRLVHAEWENVLYVISKAFFIFKNMSQYFFQMVTVTTKYL